MNCEFESLGKKMCPLRYHDHSLFYCEILRVYYNWIISFNHILWPRNWPSYNLFFSSFPLPSRFRGRRVSTLANTFKRPGFSGERVYPVRRLATFYSRRFGRQHVSPCNIIVVLYASKLWVQCVIQIDEPDRADWFSFKTRSWLYL